MRAFWGEITPDVRGIAVGWTPDTALCRVFFDHPLGDLECETVAAAETEVISDLPYSDSTDFEGLYVPTDVKLELPSVENWTWIFLRREAWTHDRVMPG